MSKLTFGQVKGIYELLLDSLWVGKGESIEDMKPCRAIYSATSIDNLLNKETIIMLLFSFEAVP